VDLRARRAGIMSGSPAWLRRDAAALVIGLALATVACTTGFVSYTHISALTLQVHQSWKTAHLTPIFIDGQIIIGSAVYMTLPGRGRWWGMLGMIPGLAESLYANWESGALYGHRAAVWATVAAQAFAVSTFLFERWLKVQVDRGTIPWPATTANPQADDASATPGGIIPEVPRPLTPDAALRALLGSESDQVLALLLGVSRNKIRAWRGRIEMAGQDEDEPGAPAPEDGPQVRYAAFAEAAAGASQGHAPAAMNGSGHGG
jgi:hypothetical protein